MCMNLKYKMENKTKWDKRAQDKFEVGKRIIPGVFNRCVEQFRFFSKTNPKGALGAVSYVHLPKLDVGFKQCTVEGQILAAPAKNAHK